LNNYPTEKEINKIQLTFSKKEINAIMDWKNHWYKRWKHLSQRNKILALQNLILRITTAIPEISNPKIKKSYLYAYIPTTKTILIDKNNPSIISTLHETGHFIRGPNELQVCRWSTQLFQQCFPNTFKTLKWKGHLLVKK